MEIYTIPGNPIAWKRARTCRGRYFDAQSDIKKQIQLVILAQKPPKPPASHSLHITMTFVMPKATKLSKLKKMALEGKPHYNRPDLSNLVKFYEDALNEILWQDDKYITKLYAEKFYGDNPQTIIKVQAYTHNP